MKLCKTSKLKENQILARPVYTANYQVLLSKDSIIKKDYIDKLLDLGIYEVYIKEEVEEGIKEFAILKEETEEFFKNKVKEILENHTYQNNEKLAEIIETADKIILDIISEPKVVEAIYDIKERNADLYEHSVSLCTYVTLVGIKMDFSKEILHDLGVAGLLHDIGLRYIPLDFYNKEIWDMTESEQIEYRKHPIYGYTILEKEDWVSENVKSLILSHHERINGSGFPLKAENLSMECRVLGMCDAFDEMISGIGCVRSKVYRAVEYIKSCQDIYFDKKITDVFLDLIAVYPVGSKVITNEGEEAIIIKQNKGFPERPILKITRDADGNMIAKEMIKDMVKNNHIFIDTVLD